MICVLPTTAPAASQVRQPSPLADFGLDTKGHATDSVSSVVNVRLQVFSDLHHDVVPTVLPTLAAGVDVVVVAGDTCEGPLRAFDVLRRAIPEPTPIVMVAGNHEHYRAFYSETLDEARRHAPAYGVTYLENDTAVVAGVFFIGCTLWTDYCLDGPQRRAAAMVTARHGMNDHRTIGWRKEPWERFRPEQALAMHVASRRYLSGVMAQTYDGPTVVVTHHAPHPDSIHPRYDGDALNAAFASNCATLIEKGRPALWVHGHVHKSFDYRVGLTRVVCNPRGYGGENPDFDPQMVVEVS